MAEAAVRQPKGTPAGGQFASTAHAEPDLALKATSPELTQFGQYQVSADALKVARELWGDIGHLPEWRIHSSAADWAAKRGYRSEYCDQYTDADNCHISGAVILSDSGPSITLSGQGQRNFSVDLEDGEGATLDEGDEDGSIWPVTFVYP